MSDEVGTPSSSRERARVKARSVRALALILLKVNDRGACLAARPEAVDCSNPWHHETALAGREHRSS